MEQFCEALAQEMEIDAWQVAAALELLDGGATIHFVERYRREATGGLDTLQLSRLVERTEIWRAFLARRSAILGLMAGGGILGPEIEARIMAARDMTELEDTYLPYRTRKRNRAMAAREKGLEPLAVLLSEQDPGHDPRALAAKAIEDGADAATPDEALMGARDLLAEFICEDKTIRENLRDLFGREAMVRSNLVPGAEGDPRAMKFRDFFDYAEPLASIPSHRYLALRRAEGRKIVALSIRPDEEAAIDLMRELILVNDSPAAKEVEAAITDCWRRLLGPQLEAEFRTDAQKRSDSFAIGIFAVNVNSLLLAPALGDEPVLALDPGFVSGCKAVVLSRAGDHVEEITVHPNGGSEKRRREAKERLLDMIVRHDIEYVAVGNGSGGRETENYVRSIPDLPPYVKIIPVNENGASIYSVSPVAREELPHLDAQSRGAVSLGRRLKDPLAELVKIDPKAVGVGQYQQDVDQAALKKRLDEVISGCVNYVGADLNTASPQLLARVSGLDLSLARSIVRRRERLGPFRNRQELLEVERMTAKAFEQCAGFLRVRGGDNPLDDTSIHPESYHVVERMAADLNVTVETLLADANLRGHIDQRRYCDGKMGLPGIRTILGQLDEPGRDPRRSFKYTDRTTGYKSLAEIRPGMYLTGPVTNVTDFGAFIDIGLSVNGLIHKSQMAERFVRHPTEVVHVGMEVTAKVLEVDVPRGRLTLTMRSSLTTDAGRPCDETGGGDRLRTRFSPGQLAEAGKAGKGKRQKGPGRGPDVHPGVRIDPGQMPEAVEGDPSAPFNSAFQALNKLI
jgi:uncharacterized protein